jgi:hypothetical protein
MAISSNLNDFLTRIGEGVKPNMFVVDIQWPQGAGVATSNEDKDLVNILCKSAALPASNLGVIEIPFRGRTVKIAGDRTFDTWTATFFNDKDFRIRSYFEKWLEKINSHQANTGELYKPSAGTDGYMAPTVLVKQLKKDGQTNGSVIRQYELKHAFPTNISQIDLAYDSNDQIEEFTVEFQYSYWTTVTASNSSGSPAAAGASNVSIA